MDFEIEDDPSYDDFDWNKKKQKSSNYFGGDENENDEYMYDFQVDNKKTKPFSISAFSPNPVTRKSDPALSKSVVPSNASAMERAQSMLSKYSNKPLKEPVSDFRKQTAKTFEEDDLSIGSKEFSDIEISDSEDFNAKKPTHKVL